ncbi:MAG: hypothetical protein ABUJ98_15740 [Hyphomicrobium sp.]
MAAQALGLLGLLADSAASVAGFMQAQKNAKALNRVGRMEEERVFEYGRRVIGSQRAAYSASGVTLEGTPQDVMDDTVRLMLQEATRAALPYFQKAASIKSQAIPKLISGLAGATTQAAGRGAFGGGTPGQSSLLGGSKYVGEGWTVASMSGR